jgi:hypothetical protein
LPSIAQRNPRSSRLVALLSAALLIAAGAAGLVAAACGDSDTSALSAMEELMQIGQSPGTTNQVLLGKLPPGLPAGLPEYPGATLIGSTITTGTSGLGLGVLRESSDPVDKIYAFFEQALGVAPWQIEVSTYPGKVAGVQFSNLDDPTLAGAVVIQPSSANNGKSVIFLSIQSTSAAATAEPFQLGASKPLPKNWPPITVYPNGTVTDTGWGQTATSTEWQITFLAQAAPTDIITYYKSELTRIGLPVADEAPQGEALVISFKGVQGPDTWAGAISAGPFTEDPTYTQVVIQTSLSTSATPQPAATPTPAP